MTDATPDDQHGGRTTGWHEWCAALSLTLAELLMTGCVLCLVLASYAWWGNPESPLGELWKASIVCWVLEWFARALHQYSLKRIIHLNPELKAEVQTWNTLSQVRVPKLTDSKEKQEK